MFTNVFLGPLITSLCDRMMYVHFNAFLNYKKGPTRYDKLILLGHRRSMVRPTAFKLCLSNKTSVEDIDTFLWQTTCTFYTFILTNISKWEMFKRGG